MAVFLSPIGNLQQFFTASGQVLAGGKINTYVAGDSVPQATYTDNTGGTPNPNPIILNSNGRVPNPIWLTAQVTYRFVVTDSNNNVITTLDNISGINDVNLGTPVTPAGTVMLFPQTTTPTGWTRINTYDDAAIRVVGSGVPGNGGANGFLSKLVNQISVDSHTVSLAEIPSHSHDFTTRQDNLQPSGGTTVFTLGNALATTVTSSSVGGGGGHTHTITFNAKYLDVMIASKN